MKEMNKDKGLSAAMMVRTLPTAWRQIARVASGMTGGLRSDSTLAFLCTTGISQRPPEETRMAMQWQSGFEVRGRGGLHEEDDGSVSIHHGGKGQHDEDSALSHEERELIKPFRQVAVIPGSHD
jgi:hypothetical protein